MPATIRDRAERTKRSLILIHSSAAAGTTPPRLMTVDPAEVLDAVYAASREALDELYWLIENLDPAVLERPALTDDEQDADGGAR